MHKFNRGEAPVDFKIIKRKYANWDAFIGSSEHIVIGDQLYEQQDHYCAYCEIYLHDKEDGFIEHLERQRDNYKRIFDWSNMFFSCRKHDSCGIYKDDHAGNFKPTSGEHSQKGNQQRQSLSGMHANKRGNIKFS